MYLWHTYLYFRNHGDTNWISKYIICWKVHSVFKLFGIMQSSDTGVHYLLKQISCKQTLAPLLMRTRFKSEKVNLLLFFITTSLDVFNRTLNPFLHFFSCSLDTPPHNCYIPSFLKKSLYHLFCIILSPVCLLYLFYHK